MTRAIDADMLREKFKDVLGKTYLDDYAKGFVAGLCAALNMPTLPPPNEPLTLEDLRGMNEVPVWVQNLEEPAKSQWRLLYWVSGKYLVLRGYLLEEYGESWLAYRRPPEGEDDEKTSD